MRQSKKQQYTVFEFIDRFPDDDSAKQYLYERKWKDGYFCRKCKSTTGYSVVSDGFTRQCNKCDYRESVTSGTLFHKIKFPLWKAFWIVYQMAQRKKGESSMELSRSLGLRQKTCWLFRRKAQEAMKSSGKYPLQNQIEVDEFMIGGIDDQAVGRMPGKKRLVVMGIERVGENQIGRAYAKVISSADHIELGKFMDEHISKDAQIRTDKWRGYLPLKDKYNIEQIESAKGENFPQLHTTIMNLKGWLRGIHHKCSARHLQAYLDEFFFRHNRRNYPDTIFDTLVNRMINSNPFFIKKLELSCA
jgi:hypothetical protein